MKRKYLIIIFTIIFTFVSIIISGCKKDNGLPEKKQPGVNVQQRIYYKAKEGGKIEGKTIQYRFPGEYTDEVVAVPGEGYEFAYWEDNSEFPSNRCDLVESDTVYYAVFKKIQLSVKYAAGVHGRVEGTTEQVIDYGKNATKVTAIPEAGYMFTGWSDGIMQAERYDKEVKTDIEVTASFGQLIRTYNLDYKLATSNSDKKTVTLKYDELNNVTLPVPQRDNFIFKGWYLGDEIIADESGELKAGNEIFDSEENNIIAKWTADKNYTYKILLVHVTDVDYTYNGVHVKYTMSEEMKQLCRNAAILLRQYLNEMLEGLVTFQIDEYFTEQQLNNDNYAYLWGGIKASQIPETYDIRNKYQSTISTVDFDYNYLKKPVGGCATWRDGTVYLQSELEFDSVSNWLDLNYFRWEGFICSYIHEICHTIEMNIKSYEAIGECEFHYAISKYENNINNNINDISNVKGYLELLKLYLLKEILIDGNKVGIPIEFWAGDLELIEAGW